MMKKIIRIALVLSLILCGAAAYGENYKIQDQCVKRLSDGAVIPADQGNVDWRGYLAWRAAGNMPAPQYTLEELAAQQAIKDAQDQRKADIASNLPSWAAVQTAINNAKDLAEIKAILSKLARIVYWQAKGSMD